MSRDTRPRLTLFDYGVGNLHSIRKALERSGAAVEVTRNGRDLLTADAIVLPGVGAFGASMAPLLDVRRALRDRLAGGTPCLAVCIGMHLLFEESEESPGVPGLGLLPGRIQRLPARVGKVPHMGWNTLGAPRALAAAQDVAQRLPALPPVGTHVYYVHSYYADAESAVTVLSTRYGDDDAEAIEFPAVLAHGATLATQFHPEKSSAPGLGLLARWVQTLPRGQETSPHPRQNIDTSAEGTRGQRASGDGTP